MGSDDEREMGEKWAMSGRRGQPVGCGRRRRAAGVGEGKARPEIGGGSLEAEDAANAEVDIDDDAEDCEGGTFGLCKRASVRYEVGRIPSHFK